MKILLVGGFGFIGRALIKKISQNYELIIFSHKKEKNLRNFPDLMMEVGDITTNEIQHVCKKYKPEVVIHLAAFTGIEKCEDDPYQAFHVNVYGTFNVIQACIESKSKLIYLSSREVYGETTNRDSKETVPLKPKNIYGLTKMLGEQLIKNAAIQNDLNYMILRITNVYGPGGTTGANKIIFDSVQKRKILIHGGNQLVNLVYVDDVVEVIRKMIQFFPKSSEILNIGSRYNLSIKEFVDKLIPILDNRVEIEFQSMHKSTTSNFKPSLDKLERILKIENQIELDKGLRNTLAWLAK